MFISSGAAFLFRNNKTISLFFTGIATVTAVVILVRKRLYPQRPDIDEFRKLSPEQKNQEKTVLELIKKCAAAFVEAGDELKQDRAAVLRLAQQVPAILPYSRWKDDLAFFKEVLEGVNKSQDAETGYSLSALIRNPDYNGLREWMLAAAAYYEDVFLFVCAGLLQDSDFVIACIKKNPLCWKSLPKVTNRNIVLAAIQNAEKVDSLMGSPWYMLAAGELRNDHELLKAALGQCPKLFDLLKIEEKNDVELALAAIQQGGDPLLILKAGEAVRKNPEVVAAAFKSAEGNEAALKQLQEAQERNEIGVEDVS